MEPRASLNRLGGQVRVSTQGWLQGLPTPPHSPPSFFVVASAGKAPLLLLFMFIYVEIMKDFV